VVDRSNALDASLDEPSTQLGRAAAPEATNAFADVEGERVVTNELRQRATRGNALLPS